MHDPETQAEAATLSDNFKRFYYTQTLDHFNYKDESYSTFKQKYIIDFKCWGGAKSKAPIFAFFGAEMPLDANQVQNAGFVLENACRFKALGLFMEHRYYGESRPSEYKNVIIGENIPDVIGYFNADQALADYASIILHVKEKYHAHDSPVIVFGGSYGGELAAWFRLKFPHVALGALASSAPILYYYPLAPENAFYRVASNDFREVSETCYQTIKKTWSEIDRVASKPHGLAMLSKKFRTCEPLDDVSDLKDYLKNQFTAAAQYNQPPIYPVSYICNAIDKTSHEGDILEKVFAGAAAFHKLKGENLSCYVNAPASTPATEVDSRLNWAWQLCSELMMPLESIDNTTMFEPETFNITIASNDCEASFGVPPRLNWVLTYYGGYDIKLFLRRFGSNIIFSNGLQDPWSVGGVLENLSDSIIALNTVKGSHCLDMLPSLSTGNPDWLVKQKETEVKIIRGWIAKYYADLKALKK